MQENKITATALGLPMADRIALASELLESVRLPEVNVDAVIFAAIEACGLSMMDYEYRLEPYIQARIIIAYSLSQSGLSLRKIQAVLYKHRATVIYYKRKMKDALELPGCNPELVRKYAEFNKIIYNV